MRLVTPLYRGIRAQFPDLQPFDWNLDLPLDSSRVQGRVWTRVVDDRLTAYFIEQPRFFDRSDIYQERGMDYPDNAERFIFFCKALVNLARYLPWRPDVVHLHDWQTALAPVFMLEQKLHDGWYLSSARLPDHVVNGQADRRREAQPPCYFCPSMKTRRPGRPANRGDAPRPAATEDSGRG